MFALFHVVWPQIKVVKAEGLELSATFGNLSAYVSVKSLPGNAEARSKSVRASASQPLVWNQVIAVPGFSWESRDVGMEQPCLRFDVIDGNSGTY